MRLRKDKIGFSIQIRSVVDFKNSWLNTKVKILYAQVQDFKRKNDDQIYEKKIRSKENSEILKNYTKFNVYNEFVGQNTTHMELF